MKMNFRDTFSKTCVIAFLPSFAVCSGRPTTVQKIDWNKQCKILFPQKNQDSVQQWFLFLFVNSCQVSDSITELDSVCTFSSSRAHTSQLSKSTLNIVCSLPFLLHLINIPVSGHSVLLSTKKGKRFHKTLLTIITPIFPTEIIVVVILQGYYNVFCSVVTHYKKKLMYYTKK